METFFICFIIISAIFKTVGGQACTSSSYPILKMCYQNQKSNSTILMDFKHAEDQDSETCSCEIQVISGTSIALNQIKAYDHAYCGTQFEIKNIRFECQGSASVSVTDNETLSLKFKKVQYQKLSDYCYSLVITGGSSPDMVITCTGAQISTSTTTTSTSTTTTTTTQPPPTTTSSSTATTTTKQQTTTTKAPTTTTKPPTTTTKTTTTTTSTTTSPPTTSSTTSTTKSKTTTTTTTTESPTTTTTKTTTKSPTTTTTKRSTTTSETTFSTTTDTGTTDNTTTSQSTKAGEVTKITTLATGEKTAASSTDEIPWMIVIPVIGVGAFLVLALIIVIVLLCQRRNKENGKNGSYEQPYIAHENQAMSLNDEDPYTNIEKPNPETDTSTFTTNVDEENNKNNSTTNGDVKTDSDNINDVYATPQKNPKSDPDPEVTISTEVL